jgi:hypothetical protein
VKRSRRSDSQPMVSSDQPKGGRSVMSPTRPALPSASRVDRRASPNGPPSHRARGRRCAGPAHARTVARRRRSRRALLRPRRHRRDLAWPPRDATRIALRVVDTDHPVDAEFVREPANVGAPGCFVSGRLIRPPSARALKIFASRSLSVRSGAGRSSRSTYSPTPSGSATWTWRSSAPDEP